MWIWGKLDTLGDLGVGTVRTKQVFKISWRQIGQENMTTRSCTSKIHSCLSKRNFLNQLKAVQDGKKVLCQNSSHHKVCSVPSKSTEQCDSVSLNSSQCCAPPHPVRGFSFISRALAPFRNSAFGREKPGWGRGSVSTGRGCGPGVYAQGHRWRQTLTLSSSLEQAHRKLPFAAVQTVLSELQHAHCSP